jgi:hypothetical protein
MTAEQTVAAPNTRAARISSVVFAMAGATAVLGGVVSILTGIPRAARDLAPLSGRTDAIARFGQWEPLLAAMAAALVVGVVAVLLARRKLDPRAASIELIVLGLAIDVCIFGAIGRVGHTVHGSVMPAAVACLMGGSSILAGGIVAMLGREGDVRP